MTDIRFHDAMAVEYRSLNPWKDLIELLKREPAEFLDNTRIYLRSKIVAATTILLVDQVLKVNVELADGRKV